MESQKMFHSQGLGSHLRDLFSSQLRDVQDETESR